MKRYLYLWHRWLGIALCLFMALWFVSGIVMLFVGYPKLTPAEHFAHLPELPREQCCVGLGQALAASGRSDAPLAARLSSVGGTPRYLFDYAGGRRIAVDARSGQRIAQVSMQDALASAAQLSTAGELHYRGTLQEDAWTRSRALDGDRPLHLIEDGEGTLLYISGQTGAVVRDASRTERAWNWLGAWLHWLYPLRDSPWWAQIVIYLSLAASAMALLGQVIGVLRWRFARPYRSGSRSPYSGGFARWHHIGGLLFGALLIAWIFSGLMSMRPWGLFSASPSLQPAYRGAVLEAGSDPQSPGETLARLRAAGFAARELHWQQVAGKTYRVAYDGAGESRILTVEPGPVLQRLPAELLENAVRHIPGAASARLTWLSEYDFYYFHRAEQSMYGHLRKRLPLLRVELDDAAATWLHIDPYSGALVEQLGRVQRVERWLFNLLHSWDWRPLLERPWLREGLMIFFSLGGLLISLSGVVLGWRRLRRRRGV
ncbi:PepSY domain-containing protein [Pseudomonas sp. ML96]|uniref:PepSY domain-containing protein n=1 Tax=Pseudomonas sp. ML96 TaxID=1523503 RepID=UPI0005BDD583|nr:PepSY domain-containing protein [Pseudomonas sp. ML96]